MKYLVSRWDKSANETGNNHDFVHKYSVQYGGPWETSREEKIQQKEWSSNGPIPEVSDPSSLETTWERDTYQSMYRT